MPRMFHPTGLRARLLAAALLVVLPLLGWVAYTQWSHYQQHAETLRSDTLRAAENLAKEHKFDLESMRAILVSIGEVPISSESDLSTCTQRLRTIRAQYSLFANLAALRLDGTLACSAVPPPELVSFVDRDWFKSVTKDNKTFATAYLIGRVTGKPIAVTAYAVAGADSQTTQVIIGTIDLDSFAQRLSSAHLPDQSLVMLIEKSGNVLFRKPGDSSLVGRSIIGTEFERIVAATGADVFELSEFDGVERLYAVWPLGAAEDAFAAAFLAVAVPVSAIYAPARQSLYVAIYGLMTFLLLSVVVLLFTDRTLVRPLRQLALAARKIGEGDVHAHLPLGAAGETGELAREMARMVRALAVRDRLLSETQRIAHIGSWLFDAATRRITWTDEMFRLHGLAPRATAPSYPETMTLTHPDDVEPLGRWVEDCLAGKHPLPLEFRALWPNGEMHWLVGGGELVRDADGKPAEIIGTVQDISERKRVDEALREREQVLSLFVEYSPAAIAMLDKNLRYVVVSRRWMSDFGLGAVDLVGRGHYDVFPEVPQRWRDVLQRCLAGAVERCDEDYFVRADGRIDWLKWEVRPWYRSADTIGGIILFSEVITARRNAELERDKLSQQLQQAQKMEALGQLTGGIAHDFNNILTSILGYTGLALDRFVPDKSSALADYLNQVLKAGARARDLVSNMLAYGGGREGIAAVPFDAAPVVKEVLKLLGGGIPSSIDVDVRLEPGVPKIMFSPASLHQALLNLCINARDALNGKGRIEISLARERAVSAVCDSCHRSVAGDFIALSVRDNGPGIAPENLSRIFEPFFTTKDVGKGTGMGLAMVHGVVHESGGHIRVLSKVGEGTVVTLLLNEASNVDGVVETESATPNISGRGEHILVVDDDEPVARMLGEALNIRGFQSSVYTKSLAALSAFEAAPDYFDAAIIDQTMPEMTGAELAVRMLARRPSLPVIMCTGYSEEINEGAAKNLGIRQYLLKPVPIESLLQVLQAELAGAR